MRTTSTSFCPCDRRPDTSAKIASASRVTSTATNTRREPGDRVIEIDWASRTTLPIRVKVNS